MLNAISNIKPSQMMDHSLWDFKNFLRQTEKSTCDTASQVEI